MARPVGWLGRLDSITKTVANSVRSHYDRADLAALFDLKERSMFALLSALPKVHVGRSVLVERASLLAFLERLRAADNPAAEIARLRTETPAAPRRKMRQFRRTEVAGTLDELPNTITPQYRGVAHPIQEHGGAGPGPGSAGGSAARGS
jgi:hypothetical protein